MFGLDSLTVQATILPGLLTRSGLRSVPIWTWNPVTCAIAWQSLLSESGPILADGAMGTMLFSAGLQFGDPPEVWNLTQPDLVRRIHRGYLDAGARILLTNTFGGSRIMLNRHGHATEVAAVNRAAKPASFPYRRSAAYRAVGGTKPSDRNRDSSRPAHAR